MGRRVSALLAIAAASMSGCALGVPRPVTYLSDTGATLNANVHSSVQGETTYQFFYGETTSYGAESEPLTVVFGDDDRPHPVSVPFSGLTPNTAYHWQVCAHDQEEDPPRDVCSEDQAFTTGPSGGRNAIAFSSNRDGNYEIYEMNTDGTTPVRLTNNPARDTTPSWSPDGRRIAFASTRDGNTQVYVMDADGGNVTRVTRNSFAAAWPAWSPAGDKLIFIHYEASGADGVPFVVDLGSGDQEAVVDPSGWFVYDPFWAPDGVGYGFSIFSGGGPSSVNAYFAFDATGREVASLGNCVYSDWHPFATKGFVHACNYGGGPQIYRTGSPGSLGDGYQPSWSPHGLRIAFTNNDDIWTMNANGTNRVNRTNTTAHEESPDWSHRP